MKKLLLILPTLLLVGCNNPEGYVSNKTVFISNEKAATFIVDCARAANPMSDEEGEDLVEECKHTAKELFGKRMFVARYVSGSGSFGAEVCTGDSYKTAVECFKENYPHVEIR